MSSSSDVAHTVVQARDHQDSTSPPAGAPVLWHVVGAAVAAVVWAAAFWARLVGVPTAWWAWRDDAVITLSHGLNLVQSSAVGVSLGDRSEGTSSPLGLAVSAAVFAVADVGYEVCTTATFACCIVVAGVAAAVLLTGIGRRAGMTDRAAVVWGTGGAGAVGVAVACSWTATGWIASGMENALVVALSFAVVVLAAVPRARAASVVALVVSLAALGLARVEFAAFAVPVLLAAAFVIAERTPARRRSVTLAAVVLVPALVWAVVHLVRWLTFGSILPTTALVQGKSFGVSGALWILGLTAVWLALCVVAATPVVATRWAATVWAGAGVAALAAALFASGTLAEPGGERRLALLAWMLAACCLLVAARLGFGVRWRGDALLGALVLLPIAQYFALGNARMDPYRVLFLAIPVLALWLGAGILLVWAAWRRAGGRQTAAGRQPVAGRSRAAMVLAIAGLLTAATAPVAALSLDPAAKLGWEIDAAPTLDGIDSFGAQLPAGALPLSANPDLGKVSFAKTSLVIDTGRLGEPVLARIPADRPDLRNMYLSRVMVPDVVESHGAWSCEYESWLVSPEFGRRYAVVSREGEVEPYRECPEGGAVTVWHRTDAGAELDLVRTLVQAPDPAATVGSALATCRSQPGDAFRCEGVMRAVWRSNQVLRARGAYADVVAEFDASPSGVLDRLLLEREEGWGQAAFEQFLDLAQPGLG